MRVQLVTGCNERDFEVEVQRAIDTAEKSGEVLKDIKFSTAAAMIVQAKDADWNDPTENETCPWYSALILFDKQNESDDK